MRRANKGLGEEQDEDGKEEYEEEQDQEEEEALAAWLHEATRASRLCLPQSLQPPCLRYILRPDCQGQEGRGARLRCLHACTRRCMRNWGDEKEDQEEERRRGSACAGCLASRWPLAVWQH